MRTANVMGPALAWVLTGCGSPQSDVSEAKPETSTSAPLPPASVAPAPSASAAPLVALPTATAVAAASASAAPVTSAVAGDGAPPESGLTITLERGMCLGTCPAYVVTLNGDGTILYEGTSFVRVVGKRTKHVSPSVVIALADEFEKAGFRHLPRGTRNCSMATDAPSAKTSLARHGKETRYNHDYGDSCAPLLLSKIEDRIDEVASTKEWVECLGPHGCQGGR
jgi:hypothetical protein